MKKENHPPYQQVLFIDSASGHRFVCGSTMRPKASETFEGKEYPVVYLSISSTSHPFFTGSKQLVDSEGRVEKFKKRFGTKKELVQEDNNQDSKEESDQNSKEEKDASNKKPEAKTATEKAPAKAAEKKTAAKPAPKKKK